jgi:hypothetical protein
VDRRVTEVTSFPLCWPAGWKRTSPGLRTRAKFSKSVTKQSSNVRPDGTRATWKEKRELTINEGIKRILGELRAMGIGDWNVIISSDLRLRNDGLPNSSQSTSNIDQGVAVYWRDGKEQRCMAIDRYDRIADNLGAIAATIEAMRAIERHGGAEILNRAFTGFARLAAPPSQDLPHEVLGVAENAAPNEIEYAYKRLAAQHHPDKGGSTETMAKINAARDAMLGGA